MIPDFIRDLEAYLNWFQQQIDALGTMQLSLEAKDLPVTLRLGLGETRGLTIPSQRLDLYVAPSAYLVFDVWVLEHRDFDNDFVEFEHPRYSYNLGDAEHETLWRYDCHKDHHGFGIPTHLHVGEDDVYPTGDKDIADVAVHIADHYA